MRRISVLILMLLASACLNAQSHPRQQGTIIRMRMTECLGSQHGFMAVMSGAATVVLLPIGASSGDLGGLDCGGWLRVARGY